MLLPSLLSIVLLASVAFADPCIKWTRPLPATKAKVLLLGADHKAGGLTQYTNKEKPGSTCRTDSASWICRAQVQFNYMYEVNRNIMHREPSWVFADPNTQMIASIHYKNQHVESFLFAPVKGDAKTGDRSNAKSGSCQDVISGQGEGVAWIEVRNYNYPKM